MECLCSPADVWDEVIDRFGMREASLEMKSNYSHKQEKYCNIVLLQEGTKDPAALGVIHTDWQHP